MREGVLEPYIRPERIEQGQGVTLPVRYPLLLPDFVVLGPLVNEVVADHVPYQQIGEQEHG